MKTWLTSLDGAITISAVAMLAFIGYAFLESRYLLEELTPGVAAATLETLFLLGLIGAWLWALFAASGGSRAGLTAALIFTSISALITLYDIIFYSPIPYGWPLAQTMVWATFISGLIGAGAIGFQMR